MNISMNSLTNKGRRKIALQMADAVLFLVNVSSRAGFTNVRRKLTAVQIELIAMGGTPHTDDPGREKTNRTDLL